MPKFRKRPVVIEATQWFPGVSVPGVLTWADVPSDSLREDGTMAFIRGWSCQLPFIMTLEGPLHVSEGDWIITGVKGEKYPCKPDVFAETYEAVDE